MGARLVVGRRKLENCEEDMQLHVLPFVVDAAGAGNRHSGHSK